MAEKTVKVTISKERSAGFCWEGKDYYPGDSLTLPVNYAQIYAATGKVVIGEAKGESKPPQK